MNIPCEEDLRSEDHHKFAAALNLCSIGNTDECMSSGACALNGECFRQSGQEFNDLVAEVNQLKKQVENLQCRQSKFEAALEHNISVLSASYRDKRNSKNESALWGIHFAKQKFLALQKELKGE